MEINEEKITRVEVIGKEGRLYSNHRCRIEIDLQDNDRTMKIFIKK